MIAGSLWTVPTWMLGSNARRDRRRNMTKRRKKGEGHIYLRGQAYWIKFYANGKPVFESSGSKKLEFAHRLLRKRLGEVDDGLFGAGKGGRVRVAELLDDLEASYAKRGRSYTDFCEPIVRTQLRPYWASLRVTEVTTKRLLDYRSKRLHEKKAVATVNRELALLRRAFNLGDRLRHPRSCLCHISPCCQRITCELAFWSTRNIRRCWSSYLRNCAPCWSSGITRAAALVSCFR